MDNRLLEYYNSELIYLKELGAEFSRHYPKVASRLGMQDSEVADPYIERLMEGFAFLTARVQLKMDAEFPRLSQKLLEIIYPNYLAPTPSMSIVELSPDVNKGELSNGYIVPHGTIMESLCLKKDNIACNYISAHDVNLLPLKIKSVSLGGIPGDLKLNSFGLNRHQVAGALKITLQTYEKIPLASLSLDKIGFYLCGPEIQAHALLELLMAHTVGIVSQIDSKSTYKQFLPPSALVHEGFHPDQSLLPNDLRNFDGYRLLQEYYAFPERFLFFSINGLKPYKKGAIAQPVDDKIISQQDQFDIFILFDQSPGELESLIDESHLALHCTPIINLFPKYIERISLTDHQHEYHLVVDNTRPLDYEIFSIFHLYGGRSERKQEQEFRPFYNTYSKDGSDYGAYFCSRREQRALSENAQRFGTRTGYIGSELYVSLVDQDESPYSNDLKYITADVLCTNRDLPLLLNKDETNFILPDSIPVLSTRLRTMPTPPRAPIAEGLFAWKLISHLNLNYLGLVDSDPEKGAAALRELLELYANVSEPAITKQIQGIRHCVMKPVYKRIPEPGPIVYGRGIAVELTVDELAFSGISPYLFGSVLERFLSRLVSINTFTEMTLRSLQRGKIAHWPARMGKRNLL